MMLRASAVGIANVIRTSICSGVTRPSHAVLGSAVSPSGCWPRADQVFADIPSVEKWTALFRRAVIYTSGYPALRDNKGSCDVFFGQGRRPIAVKMKFNPLLV